MSHTSEPWTTFVEPKEDGEIMVVARQPYSGTGSFHVALCNTKADADRIAACVNSCAGLNPAAYRGCVEALKWALPYLEKLTEEKATLGFGMGVSNCNQALAQVEGGK